MSLVLFLLMLRIVNSPFGRVLQAIRENEFRVEAMGYRVVAYRTLICIIVRRHGGARRLADGAAAGYNGPDATLSFSLMIDILLMVVIGGMGTMYGAVIGAILVVLAQYYLQNMLEVVDGSFRPSADCRRCFTRTAGCCGSAIIFILIVTFFPQGIFGWLRHRR